MKPLRLRITFELILGAVLIASLLLILRQSRRLSEYQRQQEANAQELRLLREALRQKELNAVSTEVIQGMPADEYHAGLHKKEAVIERLDRELAETRRTTASLQTQLSAAHDQEAKDLAGIAEQHQKQMADVQNEMDELKKKLDAAVAQSEIARQRATVLEADNTKLKADSAGASSRSAGVARTVAGLEDLDHRRDVYLTSLLRRYRDITGELQAMSSMLDTSHDPSSGACSGAALIRIQSAMNSTEDDMRQLGELNARAQKLEKQLAEK
jgi:chromosome segregation ATPase